MKITLKEQESLLRLTIDDDRLDNDNFVDVTIFEDGTEKGTVNVGISELMSACIAFESKRSRRLSEENLIN